MLLDITKETDFELADSSATLGGWARQKSFTAPDWMQRLLGCEVWPDAVRTWRAVEKPSSLARQRDPPSISSR